MKKKVIFIIIGILLLGILGFILWNNRVVSTITLDINPSIELNIKNKGFKCDKENQKLKDKYCITYEIIDAEKSFN